MYGPPRYRNNGNESMSTMYRCVNCNFSGLKGQLLDHVVRSHVNPERVPWTCSLCGYRAIAKSALVTHERIFLHKNAIKRNPDATFRYIKSNNPYIVREGVDFMEIDENEWGYGDEEDARSVKRKGSVTHQNRKRMRANNKFGSRRHDDMCRDRMEPIDRRFDFGMRERPDRPNYDIDEYDFHGFMQANFNPEYKCSSYNERHNRQNFQQTIHRNQMRYRPTGQNFSNNYLDNRSDTRFAEGHFSDNAMSSSDMELDSSDAFDGNTGVRDRTSDSGGAGCSSSRMQPRFQSNMTTNAMRGDRIQEEMTRTTNISDRQESSGNTQNQLDTPGLFEHRDVIHPSSRPLLPTPGVSTSQKCLPEVESPPRPKGNAERAPASSSTLERPQIQNEAALRENPVHETTACQAVTTNTIKEDSRVVQCNKNVAQSAEIGSTCTSSKEKGVEEVTSQPEQQFGPCKQTTERRRFSSGRSSVGEQEPRTPQTVIDEHEEVEHDEDEMTDSQVLEEKMNELISALEPLKNISKALIALDHHMRRLLPMVEQLRDSQTPSDPRK